MGDMFMQFRDERKENSALHFGWARPLESGVIRMKIEQYPLQGAGVTLSRKHFRYI